MFMFENNKIKITEIEPGLINIEKGSIVFYYDRKRECIKFSSGKKFHVLKIDITTSQKYGLIGNISDGSLIRTIESFRVRYVKFNKNLDIHKIANICRKHNLKNILHCLYIDLSLVVNYILLEEEYIRFVENANTDYQILKIIDDSYYDDISLERLIALCRLSTM